MGVIAIGLDGGVMMVDRRHAQAVADSAAYAAACVLYQRYNNEKGLDPQYKARDAARAIALGNGFDHNAEDIDVSVNIPPTSGTHQGMSGFAEVVVARTRPRCFSAIWGRGSLSIQARSVARGYIKSTSAPSVIVLDPSASNALIVAGSGRLIAQGDVQVNSSSSKAVNANNTGHVDAPNINIVGGYTLSSSGYLNGNVNTGASSMADPLSGLAPPDSSTLSTQPSLPSWGNHTINPGIYNGGVNIGGGMNIVMNPGIYYMRNGSFSLANGATLTGSGVMIYADKGISFQGGGRITLSPMTSGDYANMMFYVNRNSTGTINIANGSTTNISGIVYAANANVIFAGGAQYSQYGSQYICKTLNISNNAYVGISGTAGGSSSTPLLNLVE